MRVGGSSCQGQIHMKATVENSQDLSPQVSLTHITHLAFVMHHVLRMVMKTLFNSKETENKCY